MNIQEAIKQLQTEHDLIANERELDGSQFAPALLEALAMAIEALKAQDMTLYMNLPEVSVEEVVEILKRNSRFELISSDKDTNVPSNDTISRQAAIDALDCINGTEEVLRSLPSAQPDDVAIQLAYMRGKIAGIKECTEKLRKLREEFE